MGKVVGVLGCMVVCVTILASVQPASGVLLNGFESDYSYIAVPGTSVIQIRKESDGTLVNTWALPGQTLSFAGSTPAEVRLFAARTNGTTDITIDEVKSDGTVKKTVNLSELIGESVGTSVGWPTLRWDKYWNTLMVSVQPAAGVNSKVWEIDLGLTNRIYTYTGANNPTNRYDSLAFDERTGKMYQVSRDLNEPGTTKTTRGDLIMFDTTGRVPGGSTSAYTVVIDGTTEQASSGGGLTGWKNPAMAIYRNNDGNGQDDTILIGQGGTNNGVQSHLMEFYLDTTAHPVDGNGNLQYKGNSGITTVENPSNGQQDDMDGRVQFATYYGGWWITNYLADGGTNWIDPDCADIDSPSPEPGTLSLLALGVLGLRRRRSS